MRLSNRLNARNYGGKMLFLERANVSQKAVRVKKNPCFFTFLLGFS